MEAVIVLLWIVCGIGAGLIASNRGANGCLWFGLGVLLGPLGLAVSFVAGGERKRCPFCRKEIDRQATKCSYCQSDLPVAATAPPPRSYQKPIPISKGERIILIVIAILITVGLIIYIAVTSRTHI